jgi:DNA-binding SARP family transcriptional activator
MASTGPCGGSPVTVIDDEPAPIFVGRAAGLVASGLTNDGRRL